MLYRNKCIWVPTTFSFDTVSGVYRSIKKYADHGSLDLAPLLRLSQSSVCKSPMISGLASSVNKDHLPPPPWQKSRLVMLLSPCY